MQTVESNLDTTIKIFEAFEESFDEECQWRDCQEQRTHLLACPKCPATENLCESHTEMVKKAKPRERIVFDCSCFHNVPTISCGKIRISN